MTDIICEFSQSMQKFLMKKEQKYGQLKFLLSRATIETSNNIDTLVQGIVEIFDTYKILPADRNSSLSIEMKSESKVFQSYRCLLLNTHFHVQPRLAEDVLYGHLVDMWPSLSPYLFIQIIWGLKCENLLVESILHTPLELCIEILEIANKCVTELEFERAFRFIIDLIWHTYRKCFILNTMGTQTDNLAELTEHLEASFQTLLDQIVSPRITCMSNLPELVKYERHGIIIKNLIRVIKMCMEVKFMDSIPDTENLQKLYALTFGNEDYCKLSAESLKSIVAVLNDQLITLLLNQLKQVDCNMYIAWAEVDDQNNVLLTLQRAISVECYYFLHFMKNDTILSQNDQLQECLQQLAGPNVKDFILTLPELYHDIANGRSKGMKELMKRYREWNQSTLDFIYEWWSLLDKDDCQVLFEYLNYMFSTRFSYTKAEKHKAYYTVIKTVMNRSLPEVYNITVTYMLRYFDQNFLETFYDHGNFISFIKSNVNIQDPLNLKLLLVFLLLSPKQVLTSLIQIAIGCITGNSAVFTPQDMLLVRPFLCVRHDTDHTYLTYVLKDICMQQDRWDTKKFTNFVRAMLDAKVTNPDEVMNNVFIPYLAEKPFDEHNINGVLINIRKVMNNCTENMNTVALYTALIRKMSAWRKCDPHIPRAVVNEVLANIIMVLNQPYQMSVLQIQAVVDAVMTHIEPLDKANLKSTKYGSILDIISDYERRCYAIRQFILKCQYDKCVHDYATTLKLEREDFIRHMFLHCTNVEYQKYSFELAVVFWCFFGWSNEMDAYDNVLRLTMEAACISLEYPYEIPYDSFIFLLKQTVHFCRTFAKLEHAHGQEEAILQILLKNLSYLSKSTQHTQYSSLYASLLDHLNRIAKHYNFQEYMELIDKFIADACQLIQTFSEPNDSNYPFNKDTHNMYEAYRFVSVCMSVPGIERHHRCIDKIEGIIFGDDHNILTIHQ